jgi:tocopherol O-methyltransferase
MSDGELPWYHKVQELKEGIATFYNESSGLWEDVWGEHMHHGT